MIHWAIMDAEGVYPVQAGSGRKLPEGAVQTPDDIHPMDLIGRYLVDGDWLPRPAIDVPIGAFIADVGQIIRFSQLPAGTTCEVIDAEVGARLATLIEDVGITIELPEAGRYRIEVAPPLPYLSLSFEVSVP